MRNEVLGVAAALAFSMPVPAGAQPARDLDSIAQKAFATGVTPGMAVAVVRNGAIVFERGYGVADIAKQTPVTPQTPFAIGSMTKQFTAVATLMLAGDGKLSLDNVLGKYLPAMPNANEITLRELLWQTSGLHNYPLTTEHDWPVQGAIAPSALFAIMATDKPDFAPGTQWEYSNANYAALAQIVAMTGGTAYGTFLQSQIFGPLGMKQSGYGYAAQSTFPVATPYTGKTFERYPQTLSLDLFYGAGGIVSSAHDVALWTNALLKHSLLDEAGTTLLWSAGRLAAGSPTDYAMGFVPATFDGHRMVWHNGFAPMAGGYCYDAIFPDDGIAVVVLTNEDMQTAAGMPESLSRAVFEALVPSAVSAAASGEDPAITAKVKAYFAQLAAGKVEAGGIAPAFYAKLTPDLLAAVKASIAALGAPQKWTYVGSSPEPNGTTRYDYRVDFTAGPRTFQVWFGADGRIAASQMIST